MRAPMLLLVLFLGFTLATATVKPSLNLTALTRDAEVVVVGKVMSVTEIGRTQIEVGEAKVGARMMRGDMHVNRVIKGQAPARLSVVFPITDLYIGYRGVAVDQFGMFFLRSKQGEFCFASPYYPSVIAARIGRPSSGNDLERVTTELSYVINSPSSTVRERALTLLVLGTLRVDRATLTLRNGAQRLGHPLNIYAAALLIDRNDISHLKLVADYLRTSSMLKIEDGAFSISVNPARALESLSDSQAIPVLEQLSQAADSITRQYAVRALGNTRSKAAIPALARALEDSDQEVRWVTVIGLSKITGEDWTTMEGFKAREQTILTRWRERVSSLR